MRKMKRWAALLCAVLMAVTLLPTQVWATDGTDGGSAAALEEPIVSDKPTMSEETARRPLPPTMKRRTRKFQRRVKAPTLRSRSRKRTIRTLTIPMIPMCYAGRHWILSATNWKLSSFQQRKLRMRRLRLRS